MASKHKMPAKPKPHAGGMALAKPMPINQNVIQPVQYAKFIPAKKASCAKRSGADDAGCAKR